MALMAAFQIYPSLQSLNNDKYKSIFYQIDSFSDLKTVAFSIVIINGFVLRTFDTISSRKGHAEIAFIRDATKVLEGQEIRGVTIEIIIMLSKSPCFRCREDLETFFKYLRVTREAGSISFTLRIANLYFGDGGGRNENIHDLALWNYDLYRKNIILLNNVKPILVTNELQYYEDRNVSEEDWRRIRERREVKDRQIEFTVGEEYRREYQYNYSYDKPVNTRKLFVNLNEVKDLMAEEKRNFYISQATRAVAVAQVQINAKETSKEKVFRPIVKTIFERDDEDYLCQDESDEDQHGCCATIPNIKDMLDEKKIKPKSWLIQSSTIVLAVTHFPCDDCLARITSDLHELKPRLILRVANIPYEEDIVDWLFELDQEGITVELHAIQVAVELHRVNCKRYASHEERVQWEEAQARRPHLDEEAVRNVERINNEVSKKEIMEKLRLITLVD